MDSVSHKKQILFVFEGIKPENSICKGLETFFFSKETIITSTFGTVVYSLYKNLKTDEDLDVFSLLQERIDILKKYKRNDFAEIYLFFDYDNHASNSEDTKLEELLKLFNNETENGKLFISFPMVEALKHYDGNRETFKNLKAICSNEYKKIVNKESSNEYKNINNYNDSTWKELIIAHLYKMNYIINDDYSYPSQIYSQLEIFEKQKEKFIDKNKQVSVLSAFPIFIHDYFGNEKIKEKLNL